VIDSPRNSRRRIVHLSDSKQFERRNVPAFKGRAWAGQPLRAFTAAILILGSGLPQGFAQQAATPDSQQATAPNNGAASNLPVEPAPMLTKPLDLRQSQRDFSKPAGRLLGNPIKAYLPTNIPMASFLNSPRLGDMVKDGKIYLSLSDALALALENNYDIAISRYYMDKADLDILRAKAGSSLYGSGAQINSNTQGGYVSTAASGGGPGAATGGGAVGTAGLTLTASGAGPAPENMDPSVTATVQLERASSPQANTLFSGGLSKLTTNTDQYNFTYNQGFITGTALAVSLNNQRITTDNPFVDYSPQLSSTFNAKVTQHLLQGAGIFVNKRYVYQAINNRQITDSTFRQQILSTMNQVENIYWGLVNTFEDVEAKERAVEQSNRAAGDARRQLEVGSMAPLDVLNADEQVAADKQALISAQSNLKYQEQIIKEAVARNLNDPALREADVIPTDRVSLEELPEEKQSIDDLVRQAFTQSPVLEQAVLTLKNDEISLKGAKNGMLPTLDAYGFYNSSALGGTQSANALNFETGGLYPPGTFPSAGYGTVLQNLFNNSAPDKGAGFSLTIPIRNRVLQAQQAQALIEYRQAELRLEQLYTQIQANVVNALLALTNDRALINSNIAAKDYAARNLDAEQKKLSLGSSTSAVVLQQQRTLAASDNALIQARATYAKDRAAFYLTLGSTLDHYGINLQDAASGRVSTTPLIPGLTPAKVGNETSTTPPTSN
jgi:outer membrane protein TolC